MLPLLWQWQRATEHVLCLLQLDRGRGRQQIIMGRADFMSMFKEGINEKILQSPNEQYASRKMAILIELITTNELLVQFCH